MRLNDYFTAIFQQKSLTIFIKSKKKLTSKYIYGCFLLDD